MMRICPYCGSRVPESGGYCLSCKSSLLPPVPATALKKSVIPEFQGVLQPDLMQSYPENRSLYALGTFLGSTRISLGFFLLKVFQNLFWLVLSGIYLGIWIYIRICLLTGAGNPFPASWGAVIDGPIYLGFLALSGLCLYFNLVYRRSYLSFYEKGLVLNEGKEKIFLDYDQITSVKATGNLLVLEEGRHIFRIRCVNRISHWIHLLETHCTLKEVQISKVQSGLGNFLVTLAGIPVLLFMLSQVVRQLHGIFL